MMETTNRLLCPAEQKLVRVIVIGINGISFSTALFNPFCDIWAYV